MSFLNITLGYLQVIITYREVDLLFVRQKSVISKSRHLYFWCPSDHTLRDPASASKEPSQMVAPGQCLSKIMMWHFQEFPPKPAQRIVLVAYQLSLHDCIVPRRWEVFFFYFFGKVVYKKLGSRGTLQCSSKVCKSENGWPSHLSILMSMAYNTKPHSNIFTLQPNLSTFSQKKKNIHPPTTISPPPTGRPPASTFLLLNFQAFLGSHPPNAAVSPTRAHTAPGSCDASAARGDREASTRHPPRLTDSKGRRRSTPFSCKDTQPRSGPGFLKKENGKAKKSSKQLVGWFLLFCWGGWKVFFVEEKV